MRISEKISDIRKYLKSIIFKNNQVLIEIFFKDSWKISDDIDSKVEYGSINDRENSVVFFSKDKSVDIDEIIDEIGKVIRYNLDEEKKQALFKEKIDELKNIFSSSSYDKLVDLNFGLNPEDNIENPQEPENSDNSEEKEEIENEQG